MQGTMYVPNDLSQTRVHDGLYRSLLRLPALWETRTRDTRTRTSSTLTWTCPNEPHRTTPVPITALRPSSTACSVKTPMPPTRLHRAPPMYISPTLQKTMKRSRWQPAPLEAASPVPRPIPPPAANSPIAPALQREKASLLSVERRIYPSLTTRTRRTRTSSTPRLGVSCEVRLVTLTLTLTLTGTIRVWREAKLITLTLETRMVSLTLTLGTCQGLHLGVLYVGM
mmetsp:Transcript_1419/g.2149  ORF Transcript_1419/g.2149 Transcript_1419/m.2149 type:complete len:226 (+) Transcript_1419:2264-2941(+)